MAGRAGSGVKMYLDSVPLREDKMGPYEIMLSESQERMLLVAQKGREQEIVDIVNRWDLDAAVIGEVTDDGYVRLFWDNEEVASVLAAPLSDNAPLYQRVYSRPDWLDELAKFDQTTIPIPVDLDRVFYRLLNDPTIASKRWVWEQYDHQVQLGTVVLPGSDASVVRLPESKKGLALSSDCNSRFCYLNPREGAKHAVAEAARNVAASGARPLALTNCLNFGNPEKPHVMYQLVEAIDGMAEASLAFNTPVVSGNVSLYNETEGAAIFPTPTVVMTGVLDDVKDRVDSFFKAAGNKIFLLGEAPTKIDASHYLDVIHGQTAGVVPDVNLEFHSALFKVMEKGAKEGYLSSAHDVAEGGIAVSLFEMGMKRGLGAEVSLPAKGRADALLFGEAPLMIVEVEPKNAKAFAALCDKKGVKCQEIGVVGGVDLVIKCGNTAALNVPMATATTIYEKTIPELVK
jgi:phosphoribosylformylglycinamidine synthase